MQKHIQDATTLFKHPDNQWEKINGFYYHGAVTWNNLHTTFAGLDCFSLLNLLSNCIVNFRFSVCSQLFSPRPHHFHSLAVLVCMYTMVWLASRLHHYNASL